MYYNARILMQQRRKMGIKYRNKEKLYRVAIIFLYNTGMFVYFASASQ
jgi:hypothetical protein